MSKKIERATSPENTVTRATLEDTPARALKLLLGIGTSSAVRDALEQRGFSADDRREGWSLLHELGGYPAAADQEADARVDTTVRDAVSALDAWDEDGFRIIRATLGRRYPAQAQRVFDGLRPSAGAEAVLGVATLLDRLDALGKSKDKDDRAASALLATRGIDAKERRRLHDLVATAQSSPADAGASRDAALLEDAEAKRIAALVALRAWYEEWSAIARSVIKRRDRLFAVGLAKRKVRRGAAAAPPAAPAPATA